MQKFAHFQTLQLQDTELLLQIFIVVLQEIEGIRIVLLAWRLLLNNWVLHFGSRFGMQRLFALEIPFGLQLRQLEQLGQTKGQGKDHAEARRKLVGAVGAVGATLL